MDRLRPLVVPLAATLTLLIIAVLGLPWVRERSQSLVIDRVIILAWVTTALLAGWFQVGLLLGARGGTISPAGSVLRALAVGVAVLLNLAWSEAASGGFWFKHYSQFGPEDTELRSPAPEKRRAALLRLSEIQRPHLIEAIPRMVAALEDSDPSVRAGAVLALGHVARRMAVAVATLRAEGSLANRWEPEVLSAARRVLGDPSGPVARTSGEERRAWIRAVGSIQDPSFIPALESAIADSASPIEDVVEAVAALADLVHPTALPPLLVALRRPEIEVQVFAAWAGGLVAAYLVKLDPARADEDQRFREFEEFLAENLPRMDTQVACAYLSQFHGIADARLTRGLIALATPQMMAKSCKRVERQNPIGRPDVVVPERAFGDLVLDAMRRIARGNRELLAFLRTAMTDPAWPEPVRAKFKEMVGEG